jgi:hypothetical protein
LVGLFALFRHITSRNMSSLQSRKDEILAKKAKLAELKKQRELRQKEFTSNRQSLDVSEVNTMRLTDHPASFSYTLKGEAD